MPLPYIDPTSFRLQNILGMPAQPLDSSNYPVDMSQAPDVSSQGPSSITPYSPGSGYDVVGQMMGGYQPEHQYSDQLGQMLSQMPDRNNYKPSIGRDIGSMIMGMGYGPKAGMDWQDEPYNQALQDWETKFKPTQQAATLERYTNANNRQAAYQNEGRRIDQQKADEKARHDTVTEKNQTIRAAAYDYKQKHPNHVFKTDADGNIVGIDPVTQAAEYVTDPDGNPINSGKLSDADKINMNIQGKIKEMSLGHTNKLSEIAASGDQARQTKETVPGKNTTSTNSSGKGMLPSQALTERYMKAQQVVAEHPEWAPFIHFNENGPKSITIDSPSNSLLGYGPHKGPKDINEYTSIFNSIFGDKTIPAGSTGSQPEGDAKRQAAIKALQDAGKIVNEHTIQIAMDRMK